MKLIVGLGNPGAKYKNTRHNAGFMAADELFKNFVFQPFKKSDKFKAEISEGKIGEEKVILIKPQTFMNLSGEAVSAVMGFYKIPLQDVIIIHDDVDIPSGKLRIRQEGSAGGHNGIKSIIASTGSYGFARVRLGVQPMSPFKGALEDYVLGKFTDDEKKVFKPILGEVPSVVEMILEQGVGAAMNRFN